MMMSNFIRIGVLLSGGGSNLQAIIDSCENGKIDGRIVFAGSDASQAGGLERASKHEIPTFVVEYKAIIQGLKKGSSKVTIPSDFNLEEAISRQSFFSSDTEQGLVKYFLESRAVAEADLLRKMRPYPFDLLVLAGFMRNLTPYFIDRVNTNPNLPRIMNIHPALLPAFPGVDGYGDTFRYGCKVGGCTVHFIDYGEDTGPIIGQRSFEINEGDTIESVRKKGLKLEWELYPECIQLYAQGRLATAKVRFTSRDGRSIERNIVKISRPGE
jgi:phosphoribosylglycinamide formyltransferase-1